jgi:hypothetical protein
MITLALFFLLRPGKSTGNALETTPAVQLQDVQLFIGEVPLDLRMTTTQQLMNQATFTTLTFATHKNGVRGEVIVHARSSDLYLCPVLALVCRILHLCANNAPPYTPLATVELYHSVNLLLSYCLMSQLGASEPLEPPPCYVLMSILAVTSNFSVGGTQTKCSATYTYKPSPSCVTSARKCCKAVISLFFPINYSFLTSNPISQHPTLLIYLGIGGGVPSFNQKNWHTRMKWKEVS